MTEFVAVDGEAIEDVYVLLAASTGEQLVNFDGIRTRDALDFLLMLARPRRRLVCFGLNYDVNQWLAQVGKPTLRELWTSESAVWRDYRLRWTPRRSFSIVHVDGRKARVTECWGFFQSSFVKACEDWLGQARPEVAELKRRRQDFRLEDFERIQAYCHAECCDLVEIMERLERATQTAGCVPHDWIGAGALAGAMLKSRGLADHHRHDAELGPPGAQEPIMRAYFGGRVEAFRIGSYTNVNAADIRSAYPWAATHLPSLAGAKLAYRRRFRAEDDHAVYRVRWDGLDGLTMPFPVRNRYAIYWPASGEGFYHACEIRAALDAGFELDIGEGWALVSRRGAELLTGAPFAWVPEAFAIRARWKREGNAAEKPLKLGLNSLYGKLAQGIGYDGGPPRWQSYFWAGEITARTRARMLGMLLAVDSPLAVATDGLYSQGAGNPPPSERLGGIERSDLDELYIAQPGLYAAQSNGEQIIRSRGHFAREIDFDALRAGFQSEGFTFVHHYSSRRFIGLGCALARRDMRLWRSWPDEARTVALYPTRKVPGADGVLWPHPGLGLDPSEPYTPKGANLDSDAIENIQAAEQPQRN